jgi:hypothetical protein
MRSLESPELMVSPVSVEREDKWSIVCGIDATCMDVSSRDVESEVWYSLGKHSTASSELHNSVKMCPMAAAVCSPRHKVVIDEGGTTIEVGMNSANRRTNFRSIGIDNKSCWWLGVILRFHSSSV